MRVLAVGAVLLTIAGCEPRAAPESRVTIDTLPSGIVRVTNRVAGDLAAGRLSRRAVETLRLGAIDGESVVRFNAITGLAVGADGIIFVLEHSARELRVFGPDGGHLWTSGRDGDGPGEFRQPAGVGLLPSSELLVVDIGKNRFEIFGLEGDYRRGHPRQGVAALPWPGTVLADGTLIDLTPEGEYTRRDVAATRDTPLRLPEYPAPTIDVERPGGIRMQLNVPFAPQREVGVSRTGAVWVAVPTRYRFVAIGAGGDTLRDVTVDFDPPEITRAEHTWLRDEFAAGFGGFDLSRVPTRKPAFKTILFDDGDRPWVAPFLAEERTASGDFDPHGSWINAFDVFDPDGRFLYRVDLPVALAATPKPVLARGSIYGITRDELDVPYVVRLGVPRE